MGLTQSRIPRTDEHKAILETVKAALRAKPGLVLKLNSDNLTTYAIRGLLEEDGMKAKEGVYTYAFKDQVAIFGNDFLVIGKNTPNLNDYPSARLTLRVNILAGKTRDPGLDSYSNYWNGGITIMRDSEPLYSFPNLDKENFMAVWSCFSSSLERQLLSNISVLAMSLNRELDLY